MRWVAAVVLVFVASCGPDSAIEIVIAMPEPGVQQVRLYVGLGDPQNETFGQSEVLVPQGYPRTLPAARGFWWKRDLAQPDADRLAIAADAREARFVFQPGTHDKITVIVVGYRDGVAVAAALLEDAYMESGTVRQYHVNLVPATSPLANTPPGPSSVTIHEWGPERSEPLCAHYRDAEHSVFVVSKDDRDCDGRSDDDALECRPEVFDGFARADRAQLSCVSEETFATSPTGPLVTACVLGGPGCKDGTGDVACAAGTACTIGEACDKCLGHSSPLDCAALLPEIATVEPAVHIECTFEVAFPDNMPALCSPEATFPGAAGLSCDPDVEIQLWTAGGGQWTNGKIEKGALKFLVSKPTAGCAFTVTAGAVTTGRVPTLASISLANGRDLAIPMAIVVRETQGCSASVGCQLVPVTQVGGTNLMQCLSSPIVEPW